MQVRDVEAAAARDRRRAAALGLLFDLDGTIVLTDHVHLAAYNDVLQRFGMTVGLDYYTAKIMGRENRAIMQDLLPDHGENVWAEIADAKEAAFRSLVGELEPNRGFLDLLDWAEREGCPIAVVTNAPRENAALMLNALGLQDRLPIVVIGEELPQAKPHPLPYLTGLSLLGTPPMAIAFEDSLSGVRSASAAGIHTFGVTSALAEAELMAAGASEVISDFRDGKLWRFLRSRSWR